jgi:hypothetical protein
MRYLSTLFFLGLMLFGCNHCVLARHYAPLGDVEPEFKMVSIPTEISTPQERAAYFAEHYWDNFDFSDTTFLRYPDVLEKAFAQYLQILTLTSTDVATTSLKASMKLSSAEASMYRHFLELYEKYLYEAESPFTNEEFFIHILETVVEGDVLDDVSKIRPTMMLELVMKNRVGNKSTDFAFTVAGDSVQTLHRQDASFLLLLFYNPHCGSCKMAIENINTSSFLQAYRDSGQFRAVAIYPGNDFEEWDAYRAEVPDTWINGYDHNGAIDEDLLYDIKEIPTIYLLDEEKNVILKDATIRDVISYLKRL